MDRTRSLQHLWQAAADVDSTLRTWRRVLPALNRRRLLPTRYSRTRLFTAMVQQVPVLFLDHPVKPRLAAFFRRNGEPTAALKTLFPLSATTLTKLGTAQQRRYLRVHDVADRWLESDRVMSANDIHFRSLGLHRKFDCTAISDFNILPDAPKTLRHLEVATMLLGTPGAMSDSHSDDPDGCNHCVTGCKLWLVWDRLEGQRLGLQDTEYDDVYTHARFTLDAFLHAASARWFTVAAGDTLFLPGHLTHKVITLEKYLGISSFYVGLPNALSTLSRWKLRGTVMVSERQAAEIAEILRRRLRVAIVADRSTKRQWGLSYVPAAFARWQRKHTNAQKQLMLSEGSMRRFVTEIAAVSAT